MSHDGYTGDKLGDKGRKTGRDNSFKRPAPFSRINKLLIKVDEAKDDVSKRAALDALMKYESRGKGRGGYSPSYLRSGSSPNKYTPHQGLKEISRRIRKDARAKSNLS